jgi:hypothetical protein
MHQALTLHGRLPEGRAGEAVRPLLPDSDAHICDAPDMLATHEDSAGLELPIASQREATPHARRRAVCGQIVACGR